MDRHSDQYTAEDMEEVGRRLIDTLHASRDCLKSWYPADCPTEIVVDLINARDDARAVALADVRKAFETKQAQLVAYKAGILVSDDSPVSRHAAAIAEGRLLQLDQDIAVLSLLST